MDEVRARKLLERERQRLERLREERDRMAPHEMPERAPETAEGDQRGADAGTQVFDREMEDSVHEHVEEELAEVDAAIQRLDEGTYGICQETGDPIPDERLEERPAARYTIEGQRLVEKRDMPQQHEGADPTI